MSEITPEEIKAAQEHAYDCTGEEMTAEDAVLYVEANVAGGWSSFREARDA